MTLWLALASLAAAGELNFSPDRPGVGDSTATVGAGHGMVEGGLLGSFADGGSAFGTSGIVGRIGVDDGVEVRIRVPDLTVADGLAVGRTGLGAKIGGSVGESWAVSLVPELMLPIDPVDLGFSLGGNVSWGAGPVGVWGHGTAEAVASGVGLLAGGGASVAAGPGGLYVNGGAAFGQGGAGAVGFVGGGGWLGLGDAFQLDAGVDVTVPGGGVAALLGASVGF